MGQLSVDREVARLGRETVEPRVDGCIRLEVEAARLLDSAMQINPDEPLTWLNLGVARQALGQKSGAEAAYREAIRLQPDFTRARQYLDQLLNH